ncbi:conserved hypothetical protein [Ricinus communis]|uniref:Uncharacterized protein n=1 Tax=Ricinus communis TaxID=3988 RepID=B9SLU3_RICCO|nr:conserved hypothetical protein [Ricinus communis]
MSQTTVSHSELKKKPRSARNLDDNSIMEDLKVEGTPEDLQPFDVKPLFHLVEDIVNRAIQNVNSSVMDTRAYMEDKTHKEEIAYNTSSGEDEHATLLSIINKILSGHSWVAKLILTLTAFALNYGECWRLALIYSSDQLAKSMAILKQVADIHKLSGLSAPPLEAVNDLVKAMMDVTRCIIEFQDLGAQLDKAHQVTAYSAGLAQIPLTIYWVIRSVLASASQITSLTSLGFNYVISSTEKEELIFLTEKLNNKKKEIKKQQNLCLPILEKATMKKRLGIIKSLLELPQVDNMNILRAIIYYKDDQQPLVDGSNKKVDVDVLRKKLVLLLISDLDIPEDDVNVVKQIYHKSRNIEQIKGEDQFEIVWLPIVDPSSSNSETAKRKFEEKRNSMPWYTVNQPSLIAQEVIKLVKEEWHFDKQPIIVVIDAQGQVACPNALPMMWVWRNVEYPFTIGAQEALWREKSWNLELLVDDILPSILKWMREEKCICLYGGEDMEWIKMFTTRAPYVAKAADISLEMVYVGKREPSEQVQRHITTITSGGLSHSMTREEQWRFWKRIVNMGHSRMQLGKTIYEDPIMQEIISLLNLDATAGVWAAFGHKSDLIIKAKGNEILNSLIHFVEWKGSVETKDRFVPALQDSLIMHQGQIDVIKHIESFEKLVSQFKTTQQIDCMRVLKALISGKNHSQPLVDGATKKRVNIDLLRRKELLLLVSDLNIEEMDIVVKIYNGIHQQQQKQKPESSYAIVWLPIVDPAIMRTSERALKQFENLQAQMPWYSVHHPSMIDQAAMKFIIEVWGFDQKTILVMLDQQGRVACPNALHLMWNWGTSSFPLANLKDKDPWKDISILKLELLVEGLDSPIIDWIKDGKFICLYGGEDMEWIRKFTNTVRKVAEFARIPLEMLYVGKSNPNERVMRNMETIKTEKLSHCLEQRSLIWLFWYRIQSMWNSRYQLGKKIEDDQIMQELTSLLSFDGIDECGWALICKETTEMVKARGSDFLNCLLNYSEWKKNALQKGFLAAFQEKLVGSSAPEECYQLVLPESVENTLGSVDCSQCHYPMERFIAFRCCG